MFETAAEAGVCRLSHPGARWLATGWDGGYRDAKSAYNVSVPTGFDRTDLDAYAGRRIEKAGFDGSGPRLLTGVDADHARCARAGSVTAVATAGLSNPAALPLEADAGERSQREEENDEERPRTGTVNVLLGTTRALGDGTLATLLATAVEAKAATLQQLVGFSGTTTDAVAVGCDPGGDPAEFAGSGTAVGSAARACVREAVRASLDLRYGADGYPDSVADADHGARTTRRASVFLL